jgi:N6-adenosine-specific RNA methylase IME4
MTFTPLPAHPLANLFPMMADADIARMADDIVTFGLRHKIVLLDGMVLDGRNRQAACLYADIEPEYEEYRGDDPLNFVVSVNLERRHLTESQRAMAAAKIVDWENGLNQATSGSANLQTREAARKLSISERAVAAAKRIRDHGTSELVAAIQDGRIKVNTGEAISWLEKEEQERVLRQEEKAICARAKEIRRERQEKRHEGRLLHMTLVAEAGKPTAGKISKRYGVYYADPPWKFGVHSEVTGREKSAENHYPTMTTEEIIALFTELAADMPRDAVLFCWATNPMLRDGLAVLDAAGFTYVHHWIWDKEIAGTGYWGRDRHELLLIGRRGEPATPLPGTQPETVYRERKGAHSAKPDWFAEQIEKLYPGVPKLEMFCRSPRPGWDAWGFEAGNQAGQIDEPEPVAVESAPIPTIPPARLTRGHSGNGTISFQFDPEGNPLC